MLTREIYSHPDLSEASFAPQIFPVDKEEDRARNACRHAVRKGLRIKGGPGGPEKRDQTGRGKIKAFPRQGKA